MLHAIHKRAFEESAAALAAGQKRIEKAEADAKAGEGKPPASILLTYLLATFESDPERPTMVD